MNVLKVGSFFSGKGAPEKALTRLGISHEVVFYCEVDKYASKAYSTIHNVSESLNLGDITKIDETNLPDFDLMTWGFPCTDISVAGKQKGFIDEEGNKTRSGLYYDGLRILQHKKPRYSLIENVKGLTQKKFKQQFEQILEDLKEAGYTNYYDVLNAKDYGIPQNRERVFIISIRNDINQEFIFPEGFDNGIRLRDLLEKEVSERYYISNEKTEKLLNELRDKDKKLAGVYPCLTPDRVDKRQNGRRFKDDGEPSFTINTQDKHGILQIGLLDIKGNEQVRRVYNPEGISPTLNTMAGDYRQPKIVEKVGNVNPSGKGMNGNVFNAESGLEPTLTTNKGEGIKVLLNKEPQIVQKNRGEWKIKEDEIVSCLDANYHKGIDNHAARLPILLQYRIRKLTELECWRLMGFNDDDLYKAKTALNETFYRGKDRSGSQLYKMAGNSIVVNVLEAIFKNLLLKGE